MEPLSQRSVVDKSLYPEKQVKQILGGRNWPLLS